MNSILQDLRFTLRQMRQTPSFTQRGNILTLALRGAAILLLAGLAIGIGAGLFAAHLVDSFLYDDATASPHRCFYSLAEHSRHGRLHTMPSLSPCKNFSPYGGETE